MIEQQAGDEVDCQKATIESNKLPTDKTQQPIDGSLQTKCQQQNSSANNDSLLEQSFEIISPSSVSKIATMAGHGDENPETDSVRRMSGGSSSRQANAAGATINKSSSNSGSRRNSFQDRIKKSGSFLSKLQSSTEDTDGPNNIQSSIVSAFSSFSSFTSNFTLNSPPLNGNNTASSLTIETASTSTRLSQINETREDIFNRKAALERKNLISLTKLIVKDLISSSLLVSRTIDDCQNAVHLNNYFTLIDRCLKHGLKHNLLSNRSANLWNALDSLPKYLKESTLMSESVRSLVNTKTADGKIKAWMRLATMQKKLPEYFNELLANKNALLKDIYHDYAFMLNDEAYVFTGLIIGVNVIDCNFFVKDANFDLLDEVIDLSPYLRVANCYDIEQDDHNMEHANEQSPPGIENLTAVLDQKNYLEEWSKRLEITIASLQSKIKGLEERNGKLEMEAKLSEARIIKMQGKQNEFPSDSNNSKQGTNLSGSILTDAIKNLMIGNSNDLDHSKQNDLASASRQQLEAPTQSQVERKETSDVGPSSEVAGISSHESEVNNDDKSSLEQTKAEQLMESQSKIVQDNSRLATQNEELERRLLEQEKELSSLKERASILEASYRSALEKIKVLERDLDVQTSMNADKATTIKIYEKDIRDKQAQVESLRTSLADSKKLNSDLSERLNETSTKLKERVKIVSNLQASLDKWKLENKTLGARLQDKQAAYNSMSSELEAAMKSIADLKKYNEKVNEELRMERESGQSSSVTVETQNAQITELKAKIARLEAELKDVKPYKDQTEDLEKRCRDYELSLEEIGSQLRESRLEVENLKENSAVFLDSQWMDSKQAKTCALCQQSFSVTRRKHHCRLCGNVFCQTCSDNKMELASSAKPVRVCDTCHAFLLAKFVKSSSSS